MTSDIRNGSKLFNVLRTGAVLGSTSLFLAGCATGLESEMGGMSGAGLPGGGLPGGGSSGGGS